MILHGDCVELLREMDADSIDACVTDPPYMRARADAKEAATDLNDARTALQTFVKELRDVDAQLEAAKEQPALTFTGNGDGDGAATITDDPPADER